MSKFKTLLKNLGPGLLFITLITGVAGPAALCSVTAGLFINLFGIQDVSILFLITLIGWMPTAVEASSWLSLWSAEKYKIDQKKPPLKEALQEFNTGYVLTAILAIFFLLIGCMTLYGSGTELSGNAVTFADQVIQLFTTHIGDWAYVFIAVSAFATMYSTCLTQHDAISRVSVDVIGLLAGKHNTFKGKSYYTIGIVLISIISIVVLYTLGANMGLILAIATATSFVLAPIVGYMNLKNVMSDDIPAPDRPKKGLQRLTYAGILFLSCLSVYYGWVVLV